MQDGSIRNSSSNPISRLYARSKLRWWLICGGLFIVLVFSGAVCLAVGSVRIPLSDIVRILLWKLGLAASAPDCPDSSVSIILNVRLPRIILGALVGAGLSASGCAMQAVFRNPMASPYVIGISSGASFGAALCIVLGFAGYVIPAFAFAFALGIAFLVYGIARVGGKVPVERLLLSGIALSLFFSAMLSFVEYVAGEQELREIVFWLMGGLWAADWERVGLSVMPIVVGTLALFPFARDLDAMLTGEEAAVDMGVEVEHVRKVVLVLSALVTAGAVCMVGIIGFVGLVIPHVMRILVGPGHKLLFPASALGGAVFLVWVDLLARNIISPTELPVGILTALFGVPFFLWLLRTRRRAMGW